MSFVSIGPHRFVRELGTQLLSPALDLAGNGEPRIRQRAGNSEKTDKKSSQQKLRPHRFVRELGTQLLSSALDLAGNGEPRIRQRGGRDSQKTYKESSQQ